MKISEIINNVMQLAQNGNFEDAIKKVTALAEAYPDDFFVLSSIGLFYVRLADYDKAGIYLKKACEIKETQGSLSALGFCEFARQEYKNAARILERALSFGDNVEIYSKLISSLLYLNAYTKAKEYANVMLEKYPDNKLSIVSFVRSSIQTGQLLEAEKACVEYLKKDWETPELWIQLGFLKELIYSDDQQAVQCFKKALELGFLSAHYNIAVSYVKIKDYNMAEYHYKKMLESFPMDSESIASLGMLYLAQRRFSEGYELFCKRNSFSQLDRDAKIWQKGQSLEDDLVVVCDQGFGDHIQFVRYVPFINKLVKNLKVVVPEDLIELFKQSFSDIDFVPVTNFKTNNQVVRISDLAYVLDMDFDNIPLSEGYLVSESADIKSEKLKVGLCWEAGSAGIRTMINRTVHINNFEPFFDLENIQYYSLQCRDCFNGCEKFPQMINLAKDFSTFSDTAKAIKALDLVITVDTSVAHLAAALGVKTFLLLPYATDWRWFDDTKTTPWYKSVTIFKQTDPIDWQAPIREIVNLLKDIKVN